MPLSAVFNGQRIESHKVAPDDWSALKLTYKTGVLTMSCGKPAVPRTMHATGRQFFAHKRGVECTMHEGGEETPEHRAAKVVLQQAIEAAGWTATIEAPSPSRTWIADVLAEKGGRKVALEVQWSPQSPEEFARRQRRYEADGVECIWFVHSRNADRAANVPSYVFAEHENFDVLLRDGFIGSGTSPLKVTVPALLNGYYLEQIEALATAASVLAGKKTCFRPDCKKWMTVWYLSGLEVVTRCGQEGAIIDREAFISVLQERRVEEFVQVEIRLAIDESDLPRAAKLQSRHSAAAGYSYMGYCCPYCGALQGDTYMARDLVSLESYRTAKFEKPRRIPLSASAVALKHICSEALVSRCAQGVIEPSIRFPQGEYQVRHAPGLDGTFDPLPRKKTPEERAELKRVKESQNRLSEAIVDARLTAKREAVKQKAAQPVTHRNNDADFARALRLELEAKANAGPQPEAAITPPAPTDRIRERWNALSGDSRPARASPPDSEAVPGEIYVRSLGQVELKAALYLAFKVLDEGNLLNISQAKRRAGRTDFYPALLGNHYPSEFSSS